MRPGRAAELTVTRAVGLRLRGVADTADAAMDAPRS